MRFPAIDMRGADIAVTGAARGSDSRHREGVRPPGAHVTLGDLDGDLARQAAYSRDDLVISTPPDQEREPSNWGRSVWCGAHPSRPVTLSGFQGTIPSRMRRAVAAGRTDRIGM
ncbi:hypothetical protein [Streptomyces sp. NPDC051636]|uniref:hypothetical protein n=1 Tax=Streptomyces sp. NPDC051636 TaxID=3365663 RepID=UPI003798A9B2